MSKEIDWSKAPEGATHWVGGSEPWHKHIDGISWYWQEGGYKWRQLSIPAEQVEDEYRATIVERPPESWTGNGLPPVGTVCEIQHGSLGWARCEIVAHKVMDSTGVTMAIAWIDANTLDQSQGIRFRPIRPKAQVEAEEREREKAIDDLKRIWRESKGSPFVDVYNAGYRKTEAGK